MKTKFYLLASAVCMAGPLASPAWAQNAAVSGGAAEQQVQTPAGNPASSTTETNAGTDGQAALPPAAGTGTAGGEIVVTGSRLGNSGYSAPTPVSVLGAEAIETRAPSAVAELVNQIPSFRQSTGPSQGQRFLLNSAQSLLDLRGLGSSRTLLLIDGRRQVTSDTNVIPVSLVERIEVVTGGASAAYGSDAVAGVANFVLKHRLNGIEGTVQNAISDEGDNQTFTVNLAAGTSLADDRLHLIAGLDYSDNKGVGTIRSRKWSNVNPANVAGGATRPAGLAAQNFFTDVSFSAQTPGGVIVSGPLRNTAFGPGGSTFAFQQGTVYSNLMVGGDNDAANPNNNFPLQTPVERLATLARAEYDISDNATFFVEGAFSRVKANGYTSFAQFPSIIIQTGNPFIPANVQAQMTALGLPSITVGRTFTELGGYGINTDRKTYRGVAGFTGKLLKDFTWNASYQYSRSREKAVIGGTFVQALVLQAANAQRDASGNIVCGPVATNPNLTAATRDQIALFQSINPGATCAPFNVFGQGSPSTSSLNYIQGAGIANRNMTTSTSQIASADISGSPFSTWAGPVQLAFGGEYRKETLRNEPDPIGQQGLFIAGSNGLFSGSRNVKEGFVEVGVPLAADMPFAKLLDLNAAYRYTSYSLSGSVSTWKVGAVYEPVEFLRLRATRSRDIRAPNLFELFQTGTRSIIASILNPLNGRTGTLVTLAAGNTDLSPEIANTWTVGAVLQPKSGPLSRLRASLDYFSIKLDDAITSVSAAEILRRCAAGAQEFCAAVTPDSSTFGLAQVQLQPFNLNQLSTRGLDIEVTYRAPLSGAGLSGSFVLRGLASHVFSLKTTDSSGTIDRAGSLQSNGVPRWTGTVDVGYDSDAFNATLTTRFFSSVLFDAGLIGPEQGGYSSTLANSINKNKLPSRTYFDLALNMDVFGEGRDRASLFLIVKNLLNKNPPVESLFINSGGNPYDLVGRTFTAGLRFRF